METLMNKYRHIITPEPRKGGIAPPLPKYKYFDNQADVMRAEAELRTADALERIANALEKEIAR